MTLDKADYFELKATALQVESIELEAMKAARRSSNGGRRRSRPPMRCWTVSARTTGSIHGRHIAGTMPRTN